LVGLATAVIIVRFEGGLGATTALSETTPWGLWVGFDVIGGAATDRLSEWVCGRREYMMSEVSS
jgi:hypothetical protein